MNSALILVPRGFGLTTLSLMYSPGFVNGTKDPLRSILPAASRQNQPLLSGVAADWKYLETF
jgi:hypothetical protein